MWNVPSECCTHAAGTLARMKQLLPDECRALGTLIEKAMTTPGQYPLTLNGLVAGINQRSNRDPIVEFDEDRALSAVDGLRSKGFVRDVTSTGARVEKFRHTAGEALERRAPQLALLTELLLRGPQTAGELRGRASRMQPFESLEAVEQTLATLASDGAAATALVRELPPLRGTRAPRWMQLLCPDLHPISIDAAATPRGNEALRNEHTEIDRVSALEQRVARLEAALTALQALAQRTP